MRLPQPDVLLSTAQVAELLGVSPATVKRWAEAGLLPSARTRGGHRRFRRSDLERVDRSRAQSPPAPVAVEEWLQQLLAPGPGLSLDAALMEARGQLGSWHAVAERLEPVLVELGCRWERGTITVLEEHVASARLSRALARAAEQLPVARAAPRVLLATPPGEAHTLGLALAELCFREAGRVTIWAGADVPLVELERWVVEARAAAAVALSASVVASAAALAETAGRLAAACAAAGCSLILGGRGAWPEPPPGAGPVEVVRTWTGLRGWLLRQGPAQARPRDPG